MPREPWGLVAEVLKGGALRRLNRNPEPSLVDAEDHSNAVATSGMPERETPSKRGGPTVAATGWRVSSYSGNETNCVEVGRAGVRVAARDGKDRGGGHVTASLRQRAASLAAVRSGRAGG